MTRCYAVSGSASGIGKAVAESLERDGHRVIGIDLRDAEIVADLSTPEGRQASLASLRAAAPNGLDGCIPCAGVGGSMGLSEQVLEVNYQASVELLEGALPLLTQRDGTVVVIASNSMCFPNPDRKLIQYLLEGDLSSAKGHVKATASEPYPSAKIALSIWMRKKAVVWIQQGVRMNAIAPGMTETGLVATQRRFSPDLAKALADFATNSPIGFAAEPQMIADVILFLLSEQSRFMCGEVLYADGGHAAVYRPDHV